jgi:fumarate reductase subunit C
VICSYLILVSLQLAAGSGQQGQLAATICLEWLSRPLVFVVAIVFTACCLLHAAYFVLRL